MENREVPGLKRKFVITYAHVCVEIRARMALFFFFFFFFSDERGHQTTEKIQLLHEKKNDCSNFAPKYIERSLPIYPIFDQRDDHLYFRDNNIFTRVYSNCQ